MKKAVVDNNVYEAWDPLKEKEEAYEKSQKELLDYYKKHKEFTPAMVLFAPKEPGLKDALPLFAALRNLPRSSAGRSRKKSDDLVLVPRDVLAYLLNKAQCGIKS